MTNYNLLACPCCGNNNLKLTSRALHMADGWFVKCQCKVCELSNELIASSKKVAENTLVQRWNTRKC